MLGLGLSLTTGGVITPYYAIVANAFRDRVEADGGTVESMSCLKTDMAYLTSNPDAPAGYTAEWSNATVGSSAEFRINLVGGAGYTYTYAVTDTQATEVTGTGVMGGDIQAVTADLSTLVDGTVTLAVYLTGAGGDGNVVTDTANLVGYTGLLDTYSGAAAAYSLRLLNTSYSGDAIVVRRASDNTTQAIGFVNNELDTTSLESFCSGTDGFVTTWYDQSGSGNDATQGTASSQPQIVSSGSVITTNSEPSLQFDGSNDFLDISTTITTSIYSNFSVLKKQSTATIVIPIGLNGGQAIGAWSDSNLYENNGTSFVSVPYTNNTNQNLFSVLKIGNNLADFSAKQNGITLGSYTNTAFESISLSVLGARTGTLPIYSNGNLQEIIIYASNQSSNRTGIETNINDFYTIY